MKGVSWFASWPIEGRLVHLDLEYFVHRHDRKAIYFYAQYNNDRIHLPLFYSILLNALLQFCKHYQTYLWPSNFLQTIAFIAISKLHICCAHNIVSCLKQRFPCVNTL
jgi:hypothetical protein